MEDRIAPKDTAKLRSKLLVIQENTCPLCGLFIETEEATLDHNHVTGRIRRVLHRSCNAVEGRVLSWVKRSRTENCIQFIKNLVQYWEDDYSNMPIHPNHKTDTEKEITKLRKRMRKLKTEKKKQEYRDRIKALQESENNE